MTDIGEAEIRIRNPLRQYIDTAEPLVLRVPVVNKGDNWVSVSTPGGNVSLKVGHPNSFPFGTVVLDENGLCRTEFSTFSAAVDAIAAAGARGMSGMVPVIRVRSRNGGLAAWEVTARWEGGEGSIIIDATVKMAKERDGFTYLPRWLVLKCIEKQKSPPRPRLRVRGGYWPGRDAAIAAWRQDLGLDELESEADRLRIKKEAELAAWRADAPRRAEELERRNAEARERAQREDERWRVLEEKERAAAALREEIRRQTRTDRVVEPAHVAGVKWRRKGRYKSLVSEPWEIPNCRVEFRKKKRIIFAPDGKRIDKMASPRLVIRQGGPEGTVIEGDPNLAADRRRDTASN